MAEITEVIHKITYEVNDAALQKAADAISAQITELQSLNGQLQKLQFQLSQTAYRGGEAFNRISRDVENTTRKMERSAGSIQGIFLQLGTKLAAGLGEVANVERKAGAFADDLVEKLAGLEKFDGSSLAKLATDVFSFTNIAPLAISLVASFATELFKTADAADKADRSFDSFLDKIKSNVKNAKDGTRQQTNLFNRDLDIVKSTGNKQALAALQDMAPALKKFSAADIQKGKADEVIKQIYGQIDARERSNAALETELDLQNQLDDARTRSAQKLAIAQNAQAAYEHKTKNMLATTGSLEEKDRLESRVKNTKLEYEDAVNYARNIEVILKNIRKYAADMKIKAGDIFEIPVQADTPRSNHSSMPRKEKTGTKAGGRGLKVSIPSPSDDDLPDTLKPKFTAEEESKESKKLREDTKKAKEKNEQDEKDVAERGKAAQEEHRAEIFKTVATYQQLAHTAAEAFNSIYEAQVKALDAEIEIRKQRVDAATKLAERGNTEALRIEEERMAKAQKKREEYARRQQIINAALAVSDAIVAVAEAASETGAGAIAVVPAVIAAIIAGYAAVSAATRESSSFAEGVVAFKGKGGPKDDANWVRISSGESVITAEGTQKNKALLEAINKGQDVYQLLYHKNALAYPALKAPVVHNNAAFATKTEMKGVEEKLDSLIDAVSSNHTTVHNRMDENGWLSMTEKTSARNRNRWK